MGVVTSERTPPSLEGAPTGEGLTFEKVWAMMQETERKMQETDRKMQETDRIVKENALQMKETERIMRESALQTDQAIKQVSKQMGELHNRFGELAEHLVAPSIAEKFNEMGFHFDTVAPGGEKIFDGNRQVIAQVDIILKNSDYIVAVEVKTRPLDRDVPKHIERLEILRQHWNKRGEQRILRGAIAGAIFPETVKKAALDAGLYVIVQSGDTMKIDVPQGFVPREFT